MEKECLVKSFLVLMPALVFFSVGVWNDAEAWTGNPPDSTPIERSLKMRKPAVAGMFYDSNPERLRTEIETYLSKAEPGDVPGDPIALISPHAGYSFSGRAAAYGFKLLEKGRIRRIIILAPSHSVPFRGVSIVDAQGYETPLGAVGMDRSACDRLLQEERFTSIPEVHQREHSLEVQLPFLQVALGNGFELVPLVVGQLQRADYPEISRAVQEVLKAGDLVVVSSDFTHQGPRFGYVPYKTNVQEKIRELDMGAVQQILSKDREGFIDYVERTGATICGRAPIGILLGLLPEDAEGSLLTYYTSAEITGDESDTVSYVSLAFGSRSGW